MPRPKASASIVPAKKQPTMNSDRSTPHEKLLERLENMVREKFPLDRAETAARFVRLYYARVRMEVLETRDLLDLYGCALAHLTLARRRQRGETLVRVYNPTLEEDGWECPHSVIEIVVEDMPFLVDSVRMSVNRRDLKILRIIHPILSVLRDSRGVLATILDRNGAEDSAADVAPQREAVMHFEILRQTDRRQLAELESELVRVLADVRRAVEDWKPMRAALSKLTADIEENPPPLNPTEVVESLAFLRWLGEDHFTFLGYRVYTLSGNAGEEALEIVPGSGLGILREREDSEESHSFASLPAELRAHARRPNLLVLTKSNARATVHRPANLDYIGVKRIDAEGRVFGEHRFLGLYGSRAYNCLPRDIPVVRRRVARVMERADLDPDSHSAKALTHVLETYPRDELFQIEDDDLFRIVTGIMQLAEEQRPRLFMREDLYGRFVTCLVYAPRERYDTKARMRMQRILREALNASEVEFSVSLSESMLARILFTARTRPGKIPDYDPREIEARLVDAIQSWEDRLQAALLEHQGEERGSALFQVYAGAFPAGYREDFPARTAVRDIEHMERLDAGNELRMSLYTPLESPPSRLRFKVFRYARTLPLSQALPMLENMGVRVEDERPYRVERRGSPSLWVHDFGLAYEGDAVPDWGEVRELFQDCFAMVWYGRVQDDSFNRLVVKARLDWRKTALIRAYAKYLRQTGMTFSQNYMEEAVAANPHIAELLVELFEVRFDPSRRKQSAKQATHLITRIQEALDAVESLDQDRILRAFLAVCQATLRTNWYQDDAPGGPKEHIALKLASKEIPDLPEPRPAYEIFVYSPRMEGVHLRGGKVARGGLRWSDRREDFRTEVLGLMKAQMVKNAIIVPVGAKGGFVLKRPPADRTALREEVLACYRQFISGLLDLSDNLVNGQCLRPADLVCYDGDDPYLVVAADKGTATFSDTANEIAAGYEFWLGDAFASGGATGYDHKKMGITARGAWECVRQHFHTAGIAYRTTPFTVVGIGDMSGDVFGNGMLFSDRIKLVAAFDHRHVFIDPDPDPKTSFEERRRLFEEPASSWADYDTSLVSEGGGVYPRRLKSVHLSPEACDVLGCSSETLTPDELIRVILRAPVDLLWNGGIGTYVRGTGERDSDVGDRGNDSVRVTAADVRCRVVGEGGNLGLTQIARIELSRGGTMVDTDFVHNAGGVSCSDHEVNIKILLDQVVADGDLTLKQRNRLLAEMTDEVSRLVLQDCYWQGRAIGLDELRAQELLADHVRFMRELEQSGELNRTLEYLPDEKNLAERQATGEGLTRPEIAVLISYAKHTLYQSLLDSDLPEDSCLAPELERYFPRPLRERFRPRIHAHRLRREILASAVANRLVNRTGSTFVFRLEEELGVGAADVVRAYSVAWEVYGLRKLWSTVAEMDTEIPDGLLRQMLSAGVRLMTRSCRWLLKNRPGRIKLDELIERYRTEFSELTAKLPELVDQAHRTALEEHAAPMLEAGVPADLAQWVAGFDTLSRAFDLVEVASTCEVEIAEATRVYFALDSALDLRWLAQRINALPTQDRWIAGARAAYRDDLLEHHRSLCITVLANGLADASATSRFETWRRQHNAAVDTWLELRSDLQSQDEPTLAMLSVALGAVRKLAASAAPRRDTLASPAIHP
jgi:glutamate dehydrogenase